MSEKLVVISDKWGAKKGLWIASYFGYLQQYYDIEFHDCQQLGNVEVSIYSEENIDKAFKEEGLERAVANLLRKESEKAHYLAFGTGAAVVYKAALQGLPTKTITAISATGIEGENQIAPPGVQLIYGECDQLKPGMKWAKSVGANLKIVPNFGHTLYSDEKIISDVSLLLLENITKKAV
ncbi:hypothetical protein LCL86_03435 [Muricauda ruestringensis]|uniref:Alpha/beta hydrolase n=1 Tax=Flagellimonas marinaquae TaxID=254955 RepID=A0AA48HCY5_9FLAO|nr:MULTISPECIES: hypothetical protein [Allomuricauda]MCA0958082.1 hypothetical protein [Allomuricauda ruestringensis]USD24077.1 hypothetical protein MJO53_10335 [Allomuricauda aquimarina]BDW92950.1 hypothetical protein MACH07_17820 [Allomuricauda aquimarina]